MALSYILVPLSDSEAEAVRSELIDYWDKVNRRRNELIGVLGALVHETEAKVTELLQRNSVNDVYEAWRLTAQFDYQRQLAS